MDLIAVDSLWADDLRSRIARDLGMPRSHVVFAASHTHFGPESRLGNAAPWSAAHLARLEQMTEAIAQGAARLAQKLAPCSLHVGSENVASQMYNRRLIRPDGTCCTVFRLPPPEENLSFGPVDPRLAVLRLDAANGRPAALATSVGIHPVVGGRDFYAISPDYPAVLRQTLESVYAAPALFFLSTAANVVPVRRGPRERSRIGRTLAGAAIMAAEGAERVEGSINVEWERLDVPRVPPHP
ncbi:MAG: hypothetical protein GX161_13780, partial [Firmicutes bacterium]|nr:hypothetical protein [Bacillota bacterium]